MSTVNEKGSLYGSEVLAYRQKPNLRQFATTFPNPLYKPRTIAHLSFYGERVQQAYEGKRDFCTDLPGPHIRLELVRMDVNPVPDRRALPVA